MPPFGVREAGEDSDDGRKQIEAEDRHESPGNTALALPEDDPDIADVGAWEKLAGGQQFGELCVVDPFAAIYHHLPRPGHHTAKAQQADHHEVVKQLPQCGANAFGQGCYGLRRWLLRLLECEFCEGGWFHGISRGVDTGQVFIVNLSVANCFKADGTFWLHA